MRKQDFTTSFAVARKPSEVYQAINNPRAWWSNGIEGDTNGLQNEWTYRFEDNHKCKLRVVELVPEKKVVWLVVENYFKSFTGPYEWVDNKIVFDISSQGDLTQVVFTQIGLTSDQESFAASEYGWTGFIQRSLKQLIETGNGDLEWYKKD